MYGFWCRDENISVFSIRRKMIVTASIGKSTRIYPYSKETPFDANKTQTREHGRKEDVPARGQNQSS
jgi:hypothetical protein